MHQYVFHRLALSAYLSKVGNFLAPLYGPIFFPLLLISRCSHCSFVPFIESILQFYTISFSSIPPHPIFLTRLLSHSYPIRVVLYSLAFFDMLVTLPTVYLFSFFPKYHYLGTSQAQSVAKTTSACLITFAPFSFSFTWTSLPCLINAFQYVSTSIARIQHSYVRDIIYIRIHNHYHLIHKMFPTPFSVPCF